MKIKKKNCIIIGGLAVIAIAALLQVVLLLSPDNITDDVYDLIGIADKPETVAKKVMAACQNADIAQMRVNCSDNTLNRFYNQAAIERGESPDNALNEFLKKMQTELKDAVFDFQKIEKSTENSVVILVRIQYPDKREREIQMPLIREKNRWKCDKRL